MASGSLTIRDIPRPVLARLRARAAGHRRSMQQEILAILEAAAAEPERRLTALELLQHVQALDVSTPSESTQMIRDDRDHGH